MNSVLKTGATVFALLGSTLYATGATAAPVGTLGASASILNVAQVDWEDSGGTAFAETATSTVTVSLTTAAPLLDAPADQLDGTSGSDLTYSYTITTQANGTDTYDLSASEALTNLSGATVDVNGAGDGGTSTITLGASVLLALTETSITIPAGSETDLVADDMVQINGNTYYIVAVTAGTQASHTNVGAQDGAAGITTAETSTLITLDDGAGGAVTIVTDGAAIGDHILEQLTFNVVVNGTVSAGQSSGDDIVTLSADNGVEAATQDAAKSTFNLANLSITKEVSTDGATGAVYAGTTSAASGATLTYRITVTNPSGTESAAAVVITDAIAAYTTYTGGTAKTNTAAVTYADGGNVVMTDLNAADDGYDYDVTVGGTITYTVGALAAGASAVMYYQVTID